MKTVNHFLLIFLVQLFVDRDVVGQNLSCPSEKFVFLAMSDNCVQQFYACVSGVAHSQTCPTRYLFDPVTLQCLPSHAVSCNQRNNQLFACSDDDFGLFSIGEQCRPDYWSCVAGSPLPQNCPLALVFDAELRRCVPADDCLTRSRSTSLSPSSFLVLGFLLVRSLSLFM